MCLFSIVSEGSQLVKDGAPKKMENNLKPGKYWEIKINYCVPRRSSGFPQLVINE